VHLVHHLVHSVRDMVNSESKVGCLQMIESDTWVSKFSYVPGLNTSSRAAGKLHRNKKKAIFDFNLGEALLSLKEGKVGANQ